MAHVRWCCCLVREFLQHVHVIMKCFGRQSCEQVRWKYSFSCDKCHFETGMMFIQKRRTNELVYIKNKPEAPSTFTHSGSDGAISCITAFSVASKINCHSVEGNGSSDKSKSASVTSFRFIGCSRCTNYRQIEKTLEKKS